jgi:hypothetical protein
MTTLKIKWAACLLFFVSFSFAQEQTLSFNLAKGATYLHSSHATSKIVQQLSGTTKLEIEGKTAFTVVDIIDTVYEMDVVYKELSMRQTGPNGAVVEISSKQESRNVMSILLKGFIGEPFRVSMSKYGRILAVKNLDAIIDKNLSAINGITDAQKAMIKTQMLSSFGEKSFKGSLK